MGSISINQSIKFIFSSFKTKGSPKALVSIKVYGLCSAIEAIFLAFNSQFLSRNWLVLKVLIKYFLSNFALVFKRTLFLKVYVHIFNKKITKIDILVHEK